MLLGGKLELEVSKTGTRDSTVSLLAENKKHGVSLATLRSHSTVFHAGVIGQGLRKRSRTGLVSKVILYSRESIYSYMGKFEHLGMLWH